jgi:nucleotide-binding universal stress UspA family protein
MRCGDPGGDDVFKNVLVGVDGRANGRDAVALARCLTDPEGRLTLAHVRPGELNRLHAISLGRLDEEREASIKLLERERAFADIDADLVSVVAAAPGGGLHQQAEGQGADLVVVGSSSHGALGRVMLGDDARAALNGAPCAVAIASRGYAEHASSLESIGVGYDESPESKAALAIAQKVAASTSARVHVLEVVGLPAYAYGGLMAPSGEGVDLIISEANARLQQLPDVQSRAVYGATGEELAAFGDEVDLLVVGSRSYGPVRRLVLGSTSDYLERHARCPLLVVHRVAGGAAGDATAGASIGPEPTPPPPADPQHPAGN